MSELKRPERYLQRESIKPKLSSITEFYTQKINEYWNRIKQLNEYADALENEISVLKETTGVEVLLDDMAKSLVVVPQIVADFIKTLKIKGIKPLMDSATFGEIGFTEEKRDEILHWINEHQEEYMRDWLDDYTVEKEQLYEVIINGLYLAKLTNDSKSKIHYFIEEDELVNWHETGYKLTEKQIKAIDERYWAFAVKVEEVEP